MLTSMTDDQQPREPRVGGALQMSLLLLALAVVLPMFRGGFRHGSLLGAAVALVAAIPAGYTAWAGMQSKTQTKLLYGMVLMLVALGLAAVLVILRVISALH
jgi:hypothetical protein